MALLTQAQLIEALGGDLAAAQLLDPNSTGSVDTALLDGAIADAAGDVEAAYGARYTSIPQQPNTPGKITRIMRSLAVYYAWSRNKVKEKPQAVKDDYGSARQDLREIESSQSGPGGTPQSRFPTAIDNSAGGRRAVWSSWRRGGPNGSY